MKKILALLVLTLLIFTGCHDFSNQFDPLKNVTGYYPLEGNGDNMADVLNDATLNEVDFIEGRLGDADSACELDGILSYINCGILGGLSSITNKQAAMSISLWFYRVDNSCDNTNNLLGKWNDANNFGYYVDFEDNHIRFEVEQIGTSTELSVESTQTYTDSDWHHLVVTARELYNISEEHESSEISMFIDGVLIGEDSSEHELDIPVLAPLIIGAIKLEMGLPSGEVECNVDDIKIFRDYLDIADVQALYNETTLD